MEPIFIRFELGWYPRKSGHIREYAPHRFRRKSILALGNVAVFALAQAGAHTDTGWHGVALGKIALAAGICIVIAVAVSGLLQGVLFHKFQRMTPSTWRAEGSRQYVAGTLARALCGVVFPLLYIYTGMPQGVTHSQDASLWLVAGLKFGVFAWGALSLPQVLSTATFVNVHRAFVVGLALDWLLICLGCGLVCTKILTVTIPK